MVGTIWDLCLGWLYLLSHMVCPGGAKNQEETCLINVRPLSCPAASSSAMIPWKGHLIDVNYPCFLFCHLVLYTHYDSKNCLFLISIFLLASVLCSSISFHNCTASGNRNFWFSSVLKSNHHALMEIKSMLIEKTFSKLWIQFQNELHYSHEKWGIYDPMSFPVLLQNIFWFYKNFYRINEKGNFAKYF